MIDNTDGSASILVAIFVGVMIIAAIYIGSCLILGGRYVEGFIVTFGTLSITWWIGSKCVGE